MKSGGKTVCKVTQGNVKIPCKPNTPKKKKGKTFGAEVSAGVLAAYTKKDDNAQSYGVGELKLRAFRKITSERASLGAQIQVFHGFFRFTDNKNELSNNIFSGFSGGPFLDAQLSKKLPLRLALSPQIGAAFPNGRDPLLHLTFNIGLKYFVSKRFFIEGHLNLGSIIEKGSGVDVQNGGQTTLPESDGKGYLIISGGLNLGIALY